MTRRRKNQACTIAEVGNGAPEGAGLRPFCQGRDLGIKAATDTACGAHVIGAVPGMQSPAVRHSHPLELQMVYVAEGWVVLEHEGGGKPVLREGSCMLQPPGMRHRELRRFDETDLPKIVLAAGLETRKEAAA